MISSPPALQLYSVREQLATGRAPVLRRIAAFGYGAVEPYDVRTDPDALRADLDEAGLAVCSVHARALGEDADALLRRRPAVGGGTVIVPSVPRERFADADAIAALARELNEAAARAADCGLRFGYHNHDFELRPGRRPGRARGTRGRARPGGDPRGRHLLGGGRRPGPGAVPALLGRLGDRVRYLHVKDGPVTRDDPMTAVGTGRMPVAEILAAAPAAEWHVVELDRCATDMLTAVRDSIGWLTARGLATAAPAR